METGLKDSLNTPSSYRIDRLSTQAQLDTLEQEWRELIAGIPGAPIFLTWEWIRTWWYFYGWDRELWLLTARDEQGHLLGIAPWMKEIEKIGLMGVRKIAFIGAGVVYPVHLDILAPPSCREELSQASLEYMFRRSGQWDILSLTSLAQESALNSLLSTDQRRVRKGCRVSSPYMSLPLSWDILLGTLNKKLRRNLKYFRARLEDDYPDSVIFSSILNPGEVADAMNKLEEFSRKRWHAQGLPSAYDESSFSAFHQSIARLALDRGWLRLYQLAVQDQVIAVFYCLRFQDCIYAYQTGFDLEWSKYSPGRLLMAYAIQNAILESANELDWLAGDEEYKFAWTDKFRLEDEILFSRNWRGEFWIKSICLEESLKPKMKQLLPSSIQHQIIRYLFSQHKENDHMKTR